MADTNTTACERNAGLRIALGYQKGVGKSEAVRYLKEKHGGYIFNFADPLYEMMYSIQDIAGIPRHKDRTLLRALGDWGRSRSPDIWAVSYTHLTLPTNR